MRLCIGLLVALFAANGVLAQDAGFVVIDRTRAAYWTIARFPAEARESIESRMPSSGQVDMVDWPAFKAGPQRYLAPLVVKDEYPASNLPTGVAALLEKYPQTPFGITWTGGLAITRNDYTHAERIYKLFHERPDEYERTKVSGDQARDPIHPETHLAPLLARQR